MIGTHHSNRPEKGSWAEMPMALRQCLRRGQSRHEPRKSGRSGRGFCRVLNRVTTGSRVILPWAGQCATGRGGAPADRSAIWRACRTDGIARPSPSWS